MGSSTAEDKSSSAAGSLLSLKLVRAPILRAALLWVALHAFIAVATDGSLTFSFSQSRFLVVIAAAVGYFDSRRRREATFAGNLGIPAFVTPAMWAATTGVLEIAVRIVAALID